MIVSTDDIPVLHYAEVTHLYPQVVLRICHEVMNPIHLYRGEEAG
jgi:nitrogen fixation/metabolism regulation signal transduction histidine kinase